MLLNYDGAVVVAKWLEQRPHNLEVPNSNPPGARAFFLFFNRWQNVLNQVPQEVHLCCFFNNNNLTVCVRQSRLKYTQNEDFFNVANLRSPLRKSQPYFVAF